MSDFVIVELSTDAEILAAYPLLSFLRERLRPETFLGEIRLQEDDGYRLFGGSAEGRLVTVASIRPAHTLARGRHVFVDDLITLREAQGKGYGTRMLRHLATRAAAEGWPRIYLDARETARGFYEKVGFTFLTSAPCWIETRRLATLSD
jgi:GNAT superfamily N-acetyltransferase